MAVTSFKEIHDGRDGEAQINLSAETVRQYTRVYRCTTDDPNTEASVVRANAPALGSAYPWDPTAKCRRQRARNESFSKKVWIVTVSYSSEFEFEENPLADPAEITWGTIQFQRVYTQDRNGDAILNSAGDPYDPPFEGDDSRWGVTVRKNVAAVPTWVLSYRDAVNSDAFVVDGVAVAAGLAKLTNITIGPETERNDVIYRVLSFTMHLDSTGWAANILDAGTRELVGTSGELKNIRNDGDREEPFLPILLDGSGSRLGNPSPSTAVFREHNIYKQKAFSVLPMS